MKTDERRGYDVIARKSRKRTNFADLKTTRKTEGRGALFGNKNNFAAARNAT